MPDEGEEPPVGEPVVVDDGVRDVVVGGAAGGQRVLGTNLAQQLPAQIVDDACAIQVGVHEVLAVDHLHQELAAHVGVAVWRGGEGCVGDAGDSLDALELGARPRKLCIVQYTIM